MKIERKVLILSIFCITIGLSLIFLLRPKEEPQIKVAIVIDDWGYNLNNLNFLKEINVPVTISILPNLKYSSKIAEIARKKGKELILHFPLEPERAGRMIRLEERTILTDTLQEEIIKTL